MKDVNKQVKEQMDAMKYEIATEFGIDLSKGGELKSYEAGKVGGQLTKSVWDKAKGNR